MPAPAITHHSARVNGVRLHYALAGSGKPLYLLHGYPQTWYCWRKVVPLLAPHFQLVMPDLRGYGDSDKPLDGYDKRTMARDIRELARHLGDARFALAGHDRGARVAHRYALDHGDTLTGVCVVDIIPTKTFFDHIDAKKALGTWHWLFLPQVDLAERLISADPEAVLRHFHRAWAGTPTAIEEEAFQEYLRCFRMAGTIRATCADYRAGAGIDLEHDAADADKRIEAPLLAVWAGKYRVADNFDVLAVWREKARQVEGKPIMDSGHFIAEESPEALAAELIRFFGNK
ncbi:MAG TPA: alpha/beta hydrolase [bacterium]